MKEEVTMQVSMDSELNCWPFCYEAKQLFIRFPER